MALEHDIAPVTTDSIERHGLGFRAVRDERRVEMMVTRVRRGRTGLSGHVEVRYAPPKVDGRGGGRIVLASEHLNIGSGRDRATLANRLTKRVPSVDWQNVVDAVCIDVQALDDQGEPVVMIGNRPEPLDGGWLVENFLERNQAHNIFGDGEVGKSWVALAIAVSVATGYEIIPGYKPRQRGGVLYVDYETDADTMNRRIKQIARGAGIEPPDIAYLRLDQPFADCLWRVIQEADEHECILVIVDSVEAALAGGADPGGPMNEGPARMNQALRQLKRTSLLVDHVNSEQAKSKQLAGKAYGSIFKRNWVRLSYEIKRVQDSPDPNHHHLGLFCAKRNNGLRFEPSGLRWSVNDEVSAWEQEDIDTDGFAEALPAWQRIMGILRAEGPKTVAELVDETGLTRGTVSSALAKRGEVFERLPGGLYQLRPMPPQPVDAAEDLPW
jgi:hypothetical protein